MESVSYPISGHLTITTLAPMATPVSMGVVGGVRQALCICAGVCYGRSM